MTEFEIINSKETPYLYVTRECAMSPEEIGPAMGSGLGEVWDFMQAHGVAPAGGALAVYYEYSPDKMSFRCGFIVGEADLAAASGAIKGDRTPAGRVVTGVLRGAYSGIRPAYGRMHAFFESHGLTFTAPTWEVYQNSPDEVPEDQLITELFQAVAE